MDNSTHVFEEEIKRLAEKLATLDPTSDDYHKVSERLLELHEADMDELKADREFQKRSEDITLKEEELDFKKEEAKKSKWHDRIRLVIDGASVVLPLAAYGVWYHEGLKFETEGSFTSTWVRNVMGKFKPTRR